jgi:hypothetical protein
MAAALRRRGIFAPSIRPPTVPEGQSLVRISLSYAHGEEMIERLVAALPDLPGRPPRHPVDGDPADGAPSFAP